MKKLLFLYVTIILLVTSCNYGDDAAIIVARYSDDVIKESQYIDDLFRQMQQYEDEALKLIQRGKLEESVAMRVNSFKAAEEIESIVYRLEQNRPPNAQLSDDVENALRAISEVNTYTRLATTESQAIASIKTGIEEISGKELTSFQEAYMNIYLKELVCLNVISLLTKGELLSESDYNDFFLDKALGIILPVEYNQFYGVIKDINSYAKEVAEGTSFNEILYRQRSLEGCKAF